MKTTDHKIEHVDWLKSDLSLGFDVHGSTPHDDIIPGFEKDRMQVKVVQPGKKKTKDFGAVAVDDKATVAQLKLAFEKATRISRHRQAFKVLDAKSGALKVREATLARVSLVPLDD